MTRKPFIIVLYVLLGLLVLFTASLIYALHAKTKTIFGQTPTTDTALMFVVFSYINVMLIKNLKKVKK